MELGLPVREASEATAAEKVLHVLAAFEVSADWSLGDLAAHLGLPKSTVHRLLGTLKSLDFVHQSPVDSRYRLGVRVQRLASRARDHDAIAYAAQPILQGLVEETSETAFLTVRDGLHSLCIARVNTPQPVALLIDVGVASPLHLGASNSVLLAFQPEPERSLILSQTVLQPEERKAAETRMRRIVADGFAYSASEFTPGAAALGVPILGPDGSALAGLSLGAPEYRFDFDRAMELLPALRTWSERLRLSLATQAR